MTYMKLSKVPKKKRTWNMDHAQRRLVPNFVTKGFLLAEREKKTKKTKQKWKSKKEKEEFLPLHSFKRIWMINKGQQKRKQKIKTYVWASLGLQILKIVIVSVFIFSLIPSSSASPFDHLAILALFLFFNLCPDCFFTLNYETPAK